MVFPRSFRIIVCYEFSCRSTPDVAVFDGFDLVLCTYFLRFFLATNNEYRKCNVIKKCPQYRSVGRHTGEGGRREQAPLLPFSWGSSGSKNSLFKCNDLFSNC